MSPHNFLKKPVPTMATVNKPAEPTQHSISLKVMRLTKPKLKFVTPFTSERADLLSPVLHGGNNAYPYSQENSTAADNAIEEHQLANTDALGITPFLQLPNNSGSIYLGETFSSYLSLNNHTPYAVQKVVVKAELQTPSSKKYSLLDTTSTPTEIASVSNSDHILTHEVKEPGSYVLGCTASYATKEGERRQFRKFFRFQVVQPLSLKQKVHEIGNDILLEVQLQNSTKNDIFIENTRLDANAALVSKPIGESLSCSRAMLPPNSIRQLAFRLSPKSHKVSALHAASRVGFVGRLDVSWRASLGDCGRLQTAQFTRKLAAHAKRALELHVLKPPESLVLERETVLELELTNHTGRSVVPVLSLQQGVGAGFVDHAGELRRSAAAAAATAAGSGAAGSGASGAHAPAAGGGVLGTAVEAVPTQLAASGDDDGDERGVLFVGRCGRVLGELATGARVSTPLRAVAVLRGMQSVGGVTVTDRLTGETFAFPHLFDVLVLDPEDTVASL